MTTGPIPPPPGNSASGPDILTPEMQAIASALKPILMEVFREFAAATTKNVPPQVSAAVIENLKKEFGPMVMQVVERLGAQGGANPDFWMTPVRVQAVNTFDVFLEDPKSEKHAFFETTPAQLLQNLHDAVVRSHMYMVAADSEIGDEEEEEDDDQGERPRSRRR